MKRTLKVREDAINYVLAEHFPFVGEDPVESIVTGFRTFIPDITEQLGPLATVWDNEDNDVGFGTVSLDAKWDFYSTYRFKNESDAVWFKLRCG